MAQDVYGHTEGLKSSQKQALEKLYSRRIPIDAAVTPEFAHHLTSISAELNRKVGVFVDRRGRVDAVMLGDAHRVFLPDVGRLRAAATRLRGERLVVTALTSTHGGLISDDEITDLLKLRLDLVVSLEVVPGGRPGAVEYAHILPDPRQDARHETHRFRQVGEVPQGFAVLMRALEQELDRKVDRLRATGGTPALLVHVDAGERDADARLREMRELCRSANVAIVDVVQQRRGRVDPRFVVGQGKLQEVELMCLDRGAELLIFDCDLSPTQSRAISERIETKVIDRTQLILDIFAQRATSHDGKLQVELAQLKYMLPKLIQKNTAMSRLTGGIGGRGPGETKLEINRRRARDRITRLEHELDRLSQQRLLRRRRRGAREVPVVSLVGYTNAGKSTLLNTLTKAEVLAEDKLFATLDPTSRRLRFPSEREVVLTDTVGFIRDLPRDLVAAFKATLEELDDADVLVHVVDASDPDFEHHMRAVESILSDLGLDKKQRIIVFNKADLVTHDDVDALASAFGAVPTSAIQASATTRLLEAIDEVLWRRGRLPPDAVEAVRTVVVKQLDEAPATEIARDVVVSFVEEPALTGDIGQDLGVVAHANPPRPRSSAL